MVRMATLAMVVVLSALSGGCATITTGGFQTVSVKTDPEGADCRFSREGNVIARVSPTPGSILIGKGTGSISIVCTKDGHHDAVASSTSEFQPMTLGNIILGGVIGVVVDAASGAMMKYPDTVALTLVPQEFKSQEERDEFFGALGKSFLVEYDDAVGRIKNSCLGQDCERQLQAAESGRTTRLAELEQKRLGAKVKGATPVMHVDPI